LTRLGILISGRGSNFQAIHRSIVEGRLEAEIVCVISNVPSAKGLDYARAHELTAVSMASKGMAREAFDEKLIAALHEHGVDLVCLAGYMRLLSPRFIQAFAGRILNIHPSLLPSFPGLHAQRQALEYGVKITGCTVHWVDEGLDSGPIVAQAAVPVLPGDTEESLSARVLVEEHRLYSEALRGVIATREKFMTA
jgi:phosphoribosylglycinamide formyltransferase 1